MTYLAQTTCDNGLGEFETIEATGATREQAMDTLGLTLLEWMFGDILSDEFASGTEFLQACREFEVLDPNALTSIAIWSALQDAASRIECRKLH